jgi:hypothetical protein
MLIAIASIAIPWLNPFTLGPTASVVPLLVSWACAAALLMTRAPLQDATAILKPFGAVALLLFGAAIWPTGLPTGAEALALGMSLMAILACAIRFSGSGPADASLVARAWLLAGLVSALIGWLQYVGAGRPPGAVGQPSQPRGGLWQPSPAQPLRQPDQHCAVRAALAGTQRPLVQSGPCV